jgi:thiaminase (transcriptional activator TenA)
VADTWKDWLWDGARETYEAILAHPFLDGLTSGTLPAECFTYFVAQHAAYLRDYARALSVVAAKAPSHADTAMLASHSADTADVELTLHSSLLPVLNITAEEVASIPVSPTTRAYTSYLLATVHGGTFAEGLAAVLPCYWISQRVGAELIAKGSPDARYQLWIDTYRGDDYATPVEEVLELADRVGADLPGGEAWRTRTHFTTTARYEWMFWDAAWRRESWPI